ncbi:MAG: tetratricopeptide repeat protein [Nitrospiraceae bacterium]|nr:tetratricopeptide repeat protein [Nitrospiraceae bacterium]
MPPEFRKIRVTQLSGINYYLAGLISAITFLIYLISLQNGFVFWDDNKYIYENPHIHSLNFAFLKWAFSTFYYSNWHPLTWVSYALDYTIWGENPMGYHLTGLLLHSINTFIVVLLTSSLIKAWETRGVRNGRLTSLDKETNLIASAVTGLLFGLHPLHVESVAWASERKDVLYALFFLSGIWAYMRYADSPKDETKGKRKYYLITLCFFILALMSKPMAVSFPLVLLILDWHPFGRIQSFSTFRRALVEKLPFIFLSCFSSVLTILAQKAGGAVKSVEFAPLHVRLLVAAKALAAYLRKMALPLDLVPYYPYPKDVSLRSLDYVLPLVFLAVVTILCIVTAKRWKTWLACWSYYLLSMLPVIGIIQVGNQSMADRYTYMPSLGPFLVAGLASAWIWRKLGFFKKGLAVRGVYGAATLLTVLSMSYLTFKQTGIWKNSIVFWDYVIKKEPGTALPYYKLGVLYEDRNSFEPAIREFREAIKIQPDYVPANASLSMLYSEIGYNGGAEKVLRTALTHTADPGKLSVFHNNLGQLYSKNGDFKEAVSEFETAVRLQPGNADIHYNLGCAYMQLIQLEPAAREFEETLKLDHAYLPAKKDLALIKSLKGN